VTVYKKRPSESMRSSCLATPSWSLVHCKEERVISDGGCGCKDTFLAHIMKVVESYKAIFAHQKVSYIIPLV
jgi:hypothetical protein